MGGALTYKPSNKRIETLKVIYPEHFLLETDSPDIPPVGTEKPNVPANIILNLKGAEAIIGRSAEEIAEVTTKNAERNIQS
jgi:TatD DNase family protein